MERIIKQRTTHNPIFQGLKLYRYFTAYLLAVFVLITMFCFNSRGLIEYMLVYPNYFITCFIHIESGTDQH